jgi:hypothetical protein
VVRRADPYAENVNRVAFMRGTGMVVEYRTMDNVRVGARPFHAAVYCGTAADHGPTDAQAEEFLRLAEPPAHNTWERTPDLASKYALGSGVALSSFISQIRSEIGDLVGPASADLSDGPEDLKRLLKVKATKDPVARPRVKDAEVERIGDAWKVRVTLQPATDRTWTAQPAVLFDGETGGGVKVLAEISDCKNCELEDGRLRIKPTRKKVKFTALTDPSSHPTPSDDVAIAVDLRAMQRLGSS